MSRTKIVEALAAVDRNGKWIVYGFEALKTIDHLHETGITEDLTEPMAFFRIRAILEIPGEIEVQNIFGAVEKLEPADDVQNAIRVAKLATGEGD